MNSTFWIFVNRQKALPTPLVYANVSNIIYLSPDVDYFNLRDNEQLVIAGSTDENIDDTAIYDIRKSTKLQSGLSIGTTFFICIVLATGALLFSNTATELVISPIE